MRKITFYLLAILLIAGAIIAAWLAFNSQSSSDKKSQSVSPPAQKVATLPSKACSIFTLADAKQLLGATAKGGQNSLPGSSDDIKVSGCTYTRGGGGNASAAGNQAASLLVHESEDDKGITSNQNQFGPFKPAGAQDVSGYGDTAYWDAEHGQLDILKNNNWYILSYGPAAPAGRTLDQAKQLADLLIGKL